MRYLIFLACSMVAGAAMAGMPSVTITDLTSARLSAISFFFALILLTSVAVRWLWNALARDFPALPRLDFKRAVAFVVLLALLFDIVLLMIAGTRELMTPEAWEKNGITYQLRGRDEPSAGGDGAEPGS